MLGALSVTEWGNPLRVNEFALSVPFVYSLPYVDNNFYGVRSPFASKVIFPETPS